MPFSHSLLKDNHLVQIPYKTETLEPERVAVDSLTKPYLEEETSVSKVYSEHIESLREVLDLLRGQVDCIVKFLKKEAKLAKTPGCLIFNNIFNLSLFFF